MCTVLSSITTFATCRTWYETSPRPFSPHSFTATPIVVSVRTQSIWPFANGSDQTHRQHLSKNSFDSKPASPDPFHASFQPAALNIAANTSLRRLQYPYPLPCCTQTRLSSTHPILSTQRASSENQAKSLLRNITLFSHAVPELVLVSSRSSFSFF